jgi:serine/threonine-protein kinase mTOR
LLATTLDRTWYKAWHAWALANSEVVSHYVKTQADGDPLPPQIFEGHLVPSVKGVAVRNLDDKGELSSNADTQS